MVQVYPIIISLLLIKFSSPSHIPRNLLDNLPNKRSLLAQVTLGPADSGLDNACLGFLHIA
jgi:hypothetical protein